MVNAVLRRLSQGYVHVQRPDRQISLDTIPDSPADDATRIQVEDDGQIQPALMRPDIADTARPFLVGLVSSNVAIQRVRRNAELVLAVCRHLVFACTNDRYVLPPVPDTRPISVNSSVMRGLP